MRTVKDIIESKPKPSNVIRPTALVIDALHLLDAVNLSYLVVMEGTTYKGIFSERDYSRNVLLKGRTSNSAMVMDVMTIDLPEVTLTDTVEYCMDLITRHKARYLVAFTGKQFEGVITIHDLLRQVIANRENVFDDALTQQLIDTAESGGSRIY